MLIYLAGASYNRLLIKGVEEWLKTKNSNFEFTSNWYKEDFRDTEQYAQKDIEEVLSSDVVVAFYPYGELGGTLSEMSISYAKKIDVIYVRHPYWDEEDPFISQFFEPYNKHKIQKDKNYFIIDNIEDMLSFLNKKQNLLEESL
jgi:hypothetical protein